MSRLMREIQQKYRLGTGIRMEKTKTEKQLKKLSRKELLQIMVTQSKEIDRLQQELQRTRAALADRNLRIGKCGSLAEASLEIFHIFDDAQAAANLYLERCCLLRNICCFDSTCSFWKHLV